MILEGVVLGKKAHVKGAEIAGEIAPFPSKKSSCECHMISFEERKESFISDVNEDITRLVNCALLLYPVCRSRSLTKLLTGNHYLSNFHDLTALSDIREAFPVN